MAVPQQDNVKFIDAELKLVKEKYTLHVKDSVLVTCVPTMVRLEIKKTDFKQLVACLQFPKEYPSLPIIVELKSKTLPDKFIEGLQKIAEEEAKKLLGKEQVLYILKFIRNFIEDTPLCVCTEEISYIRRKLLEDGDDMKLKQKLSQIIINVKKNAYCLKFKVTVPNNYPAEQTDVEVTECNFPILLRRNFSSQATEIARQCMQPPLKKRPKDPPFQPKPAVRPICDFLIKDCIKCLPSETCPLCGVQALAKNPQDNPSNPKDPKNVERVYCGHLFHYDCLDKYMKTPPFTGGKKCPRCSNRIFHDKWSATPQLAETRWAHQEARRRELDEVVDFLE